MSESRIETSLNSRDLSLDTLKCILMFFVVLGHVLEEFGVTGYLGTIRSMIYCFHMPTFVFLSGYFSKNTGKSGSNAFKTCFIPFMIYNTLFCLMAGKYDFLTPLYLYWYLLSLFFWRISSIAFRNLRFVIPISIMIALYVGTLEGADRFLAVSRTLCFFPFFWAGMLIKPEMLKKLKKIPAYVAGGCIILCESIVVWMSRCGFMPSKMYEMIEPYSKTVPEVFFFWGVLRRMIVLAIGFIMVFSIICICRRQYIKFSQMGKRTAAILVYSGFIVKICSKIGAIVFPEFENINGVIAIILSIPISAIVMIICGNKWSNSIYDHINNTVSKMMIE